MTHKEKVEVQKVVSEMVIDRITEMIEDMSNHLQCMKKRNQVTQRRKRSIKYDKTGGQTNDRTVT